jgi:hypothetical protein
MAKWLTDGLSLVALVSTSDREISSAGQQGSTLALETSW